MKLIKDLGMEYPNPNSKQKKHFAIYKCSFCGNNFKTQTYDVHSGRTKSCGCKPTFHGMHKTRLYLIWSAMKTRTTNKNAKVYKKYGARGIRLCNAWQKFIPFMKWALAHGYNEKLIIDRRNNNGNYSPRNCRFVNYEISAVNRGHKNEKWYGISNQYKSYKVILSRNKKQYIFSGFKTFEEAEQKRDEFIKKWNEQYNNF